MRCLLENYIVLVEAKVFDGAVFSRERQWGDIDGWIPIFIGMEIESANPYSLFLQNLALGFIHHLQGALRVCNEILDR
jgi:hypothetical protein